jgi:uncharacterized OB-fold protein
VPEQRPIPEKWIRPEHEQRIDRLEAENARLREECPVCESCGHVQGDPNWCQKCGHRTSNPPWREVFKREVRAQVIHELRDAASDQGPQSAYWLAADHLESK